ncbi:hypothetical protein [Anaerotignum propionicum]|uniref:Uncharacterized protein n=1 Tax=Anaerotignum propionicum DSM 1682 TaxID=991789 RepID=A0A120MK75_ANAPI|nr:hypothetical protein [Anaerotignum propionicum]AMJ40392.1 hypothetical protein CPRO_07910 [Anaerotignum propionicum DSM 1682]SHE43368.1 hypothetical protein SAMN02745151_00690 [[Clostridium] propionicum DSM 1682] [Anaerotignum propionicum DSM 1682]
MTYAMIMSESVIDVLTSEAAPQWPPSPEGFKVTAVECDSSVYIGMLYINGEFHEQDIPQPKPVQPYRPTTVELAIMETQATIYEELNASRLASAEATAEIYEAILLMGGNANG